MLSAQLGGYMEKKDTSGKHRDSWKPPPYSTRPERSSAEETVEFDTPLDLIREAAAAKESPDKD